MIVIKRTGLIEPKMNYMASIFRDLTVVVYLRDHIWAA